MKKVIWRLFAISTVIFAFFEIFLIISARKATGFGGLGLGILAVIVIGIYMIFTIILFIIYGIKTKRYAPLITAISLIVALVLFGEAIAFIDGVKRSNSLKIHTEIYESLPIYIDFSGFSDATYTYPEYRIYNEGLVNGEDVKYSESPYDKVSKQVKIPFEEYGPYEDYKRNYEVYKFGNKYIIALQYKTALYVSEGYELGSVGYELNDMYTWRIKRFILPILEKVKSFVSSDTEELE